MGSFLVRPACWLWFASLALAGVLADDKRIDFAQDIQPILQARCASCHGSLRQESDYRVDVREVALHGGAGSAPNIIPGRASASPFFQMITGQIDGQIMPAKGERLSQDQIALIERWIDQGATWPDSANHVAENKRDWWSLQPLADVALPSSVLQIDRSSQLQNSAQLTSAVPFTGATPIDAFVHAELRKHQFAPSPAANKPQLLRRLTYDLIGMPPTIEEMQAFLQDGRPDAYERVVDRLLASPRYGERWARHWLDTAHYAETHGHDQDRIREHAWPYRDYLVRAFNEDDSYSNFIKEQLAADVYTSDSSKIPALGFLAAGPWDESTLRDIREDTIDREIGRYVDRDDMLTTVMSNLVSLTVQCARCHDHKFDPITQQDYYALQAVFAGVERANRLYDLEPTVAETRARLLHRQKQLLQPTAEVRAELLSSNVQQQVQAWEAGLTSTFQGWQLLQSIEVKSTDGSTLTMQADGSVLASGSRPNKDTYELTGKISLPAIAGLRLEVLTDDSLPHRGPGRQDNGNLHLSEIELIVGDKPVVLTHALADFDQADWSIDRAIDGKEETAWGIHPQVGRAHEAVFECAQPVQLDAKQTVTVRLKQLHGRGHLIGRPRVSLTGSQPPIRLASLPTEIGQILGKPAEMRSDEERFLLTLHQQKQSLARQLADLPPQQRVYAAAADFEPDGSLKPPPGPRPIYVLSRGDIRSPRELSTPGSLACIAALPARFAIEPSATESARRAALAAWIVDTRNPLAWRSIVNRIWQQHFGRGLVETPNDFGRLVAKPTHPQLLDWLARDFRDSGQSLKRLHRQMVLSSTYQQTSQSGRAIVDGAVRDREDQARELDSDNKLLWRMNRIRLDAECIRDSMLSCSGQIDLRMGGPSDRQFDLKPGRHVTPVIDYALFDLGSPAGQRRSIYRFLFRTLPDPFMEALDCPAGDQITPTRVNSVTVQQVLAMWNDAFVLKQAEQLAARLTRECNRTDTRVRLAIQLILGREARDAEVSRYCDYVDRFGLANFCRLMFNTNEFVFVD